MIVIDISGIINKTARVTDKSTNALIDNDVQCKHVNHLIFSVST